MFKELKTLEYAIEVVRALANVEKPCKGDDIYELLKQRGNIDPSLTFTKKLLQRMSRAKILEVTSGGYQLSVPAYETTVANILDICDMPPKSNIMYVLCEQVKQAFSLTTIDDLFENQ